MATIRWSPRLFAALGAGFQADATVRDGVHLRWTLDPRMGLPRTPRDKGFEIAFSRTKEGSITRVDLFKPSAPYPVRSDKGVLPAGPGTVHRDGSRLSFLRPLGAADWLPYWRYRHNRIHLDLAVPGPGKDEQALLGYLDGVMGALGPVGPVAFSRQEDAVAVDVRFLAPSPGGGGIGPFVPIRPNPLLPLTPILPGSGGVVGPIVGTDIGGVLTPLLPDTFNRFRPDIFATVQGFDYCDRLVAEDWVGRHPQIFLGPNTGPFPAQAGALKLTARLRAPGIRWIRILRRPGHGGLAEDEIRWMFCDDYASDRGLWAMIDSEVMTSDPDAYTEELLRDDIYAPFHASAQPMDWADMAFRLRARFIEAHEIQGLLAAEDTFETARFAVEIKDLEAPTGTSDDAVALPLLAALLAGTVDPVVARLFGLYGFVPSNPDFQARDWRVLVHPPFAWGENLERLDKRLREILDPGRPFFHEPGDSLDDLALAGLVLDASETKKPAPPDPQPDATADVRLVPADPDRFDHLVRATVTAAPERAETRPWMVNASYEVIRGLSGEPAVNATDDGDRGPLDDLGLLPDVLIPEFNRKTCLSTGRLVDVFARDATKDRQLAYLVRGFDIFGRPSDPVDTVPIDLPAACLPPPPPGTVSARVTRRGDALTMVIDFDLGETARVVEAEWQALETLVHTAPLTEGVAPEAASWTGTRPGRLVELGFDPVSLELQTAPVQQSCLALSWSGGVLQRTPDGADVCAATFPAVAAVAPLALTTLDPGRRAYRMTVALGTRGLYPQGVNAWAARLRVRGRCPRSGHIVHSPEVVARAELLLPAPPAPVTQPPVAALPLSTYPDALGKSYFSIDLRTLLSPAHQAPDTLVRVYLARLEAMTDQPGNFVEGETVIDPPGLIALARLSHGRFALVSDPPESFDPNRPHVDIEVPGQISEVYLAAVQGADGVLESGSWQSAAFVPFRTPPLRPLPLVEWTLAEIAAGDSSLTARLAVAARFPEAMPDPTRPPILQLFRRDLSTGQAQARFVTVAEGQSADATAAAPVYTFAMEDGPLAEWHRYEFAVQLLAFAPWRGQHVKIGARVPRELAVPAGGLADPFADPTAVTVTAGAAGGFEIAAAFAAGDFTVELEKEPDTGTVTVRRARIEAGRLVLPTGLTGTLTTGATYDLRLTDPDPAPGLYRVRLRSGQALSVSREARTP